MNIPIYRAKKINNDEWVEGYLIGHYIFKEWIDDFWTSYGETMSNKAEVYNIDVSTLAIHFPDMLDSQGNKIFASLNNIGGSILTDGEYEFILYFDGRKYRIIGNEVNSEINDYEEWNEFKIIGTQE